MYIKLLSQNPTFCAWVKIVSEAEKEIVDTDIEIIVRNTKTTQTGRRKPLLLMLVQLLRFLSHQSI